MLKSLVRFTLLANGFSLALVWGIESLSQFFGLTSLSDYAFIMLVVQWGCVGVLLMYPPQGAMKATNAPESQRAESMVDRAVADVIDARRWSDNQWFCFKLFVSGLLPLAVCIGVSALESV